MTDTTKNERLLFAYTSVTDGMYPQFINVKSFGGPIVNDPTYRVEFLVRGKRIEADDIHEGPCATMSMSRDEAISMAASILRELNADFQFRTP